MRIELIKQPEHIPISKKQWNDLVSQSETNTPFQTHEWFTSWWSALGNDYSLFLLLIYTGKTIKGIAPFMLYHHLTGVEVKFISDVNADYCDFIVNQDDKKKAIKAVFDFLHQNRSIWTSIQLQNIPEESTTNSYIEKLLPEYGLPWHASTVACPVLKLDEFPQAIQWKTPRTLRRHQNYFSKHGELSFHIFKSLKEAQESLNSFFDQHIQRWDIARSTPSLFLDRRYKEFYRKLLVEAWPTGWLFYSCLRFNNDPIAFHFGFDYQSKVIWYKPSFNVDFRHRSPGKLLIKFLIEYCRQNNKKEFDFTVGDEPFKLYYTDIIRTNYSLIIFSNKRRYYINSANMYLRKIFKKLLMTSKIGQ